MKKKTISLVLFLVLLIILCSGVILLRGEKRTGMVSGNTDVGEAKNKFPNIAAKASFYNEQSLFSAVQKVENTEPQKNVFALISPHHFVAAEFMAEIIKSASGRDIRTVAIIGPNHFNVSNDTLATAKVNWQTPYGVVAVDELLANRFLADFQLTENPDVFENEHSIGAIAPFVRNYFPQAKIMPIVLSSYATQKDSEAVSQWLFENIGEDGLVIFSIDFSHYLTKELADQKDDKTRQLILDREIGEIIRLGNDNVDCPPALAASLLYAQKKGLSTEIVRNGNSFDFSQEKPSRTTSYFTVRFL
jgi:AmmeMemoRadiSam system protein B